MSLPRKPLRRIVVVGGGQVAVLAAIGLKRALPPCEVIVLGSRPDRAAFADHAATALPFTNRLHDRLGIDEARLVTEAGGSHRLLMRYLGWSGPGQGAMPYGAEVDPALKTGFARDWGGGPRNASGNRPAGSLAEVLAGAGQFATPADGEPGPLAEVDYALRWNPAAYRQLLIGVAGQMGVAHHDGQVEAVEPDGRGGIAALSLAGAGRLDADLFIDCSGPAASLLSSLPDHRDESWAGSSHACKVLIAKPGPPELALEDRVTLHAEGWRSELFGRDGTHIAFGLVPGISEQAALQALGAEPLLALPLQPGRAAAPWLGNVVALGDAAAWFEPLAFLNLDLAHRQLDLLLEMLPGRAIEPLERAEYNRRAALMADAVRDTIAAHHAAPSAGAYFGSVNLSSELARAIDQFERRGRMPFREEAPLLGAEFQALLSALGVSSGISPQSRSIGEAAAAQARLAFEERAQRALAQTPPYEKWMAALLTSGPAPHG